MRYRFEQQLRLGRLLIEDTKIPITKRSNAIHSLCAALLELFSNKTYSEKVFELLENKLLSNKKKTGRLGMDLWQIFVLSQIRLCNNISYDELYHIANNDFMIRQIMGVENVFVAERIQFHFQTIVDNVSLLDDATVKSLNAIIVDFGHDILKKKEFESVSLKSDSFVVESNVHFPTDYNLLWDSARKCLDMIKKLQKKYDFVGWRKIEDWRSEFKKKERIVGKASSAGGKSKEKRLKEAVNDYLNKSKALVKKINQSKNSFPKNDAFDIKIIKNLEEFLFLLEKHIDLLERRIIKDETIPHEEKLFSIFEQYTEWVNKGKKRPSVELGKKVTITTDQFNLIVDYYIMNNESDSEIVSNLAKRIFPKYTVVSWSFDKGYWKKSNKVELSRDVETLVLPKKGKCNTIEYQEEHTPTFKKLRNMHSAIESNINELEHRGLDRCPDRGYDHFRRYIGLGVCAYNLKKIGTRIIKDQIELEEKRVLKKAS